jgi:hypothetical protein
LQPVEPVLHDDVQALAEVLAVIADATATMNYCSECQYRLLCASTDTRKP